MTLLTRRQGMIGLGASLALLPSFAGHAASVSSGASAKRLVVINLKGGLDGLSLVSPYGDPGLAGLRAPLLLGAVGTAGGMFDLGGFYGLHPSMPNLHAMFASGQASFVHAVMNCALTRSHFDGQDYLQSGAASLLSSGWLNRTAAALGAQSTGLENAVALGVSTPLLLQGHSAVAGWAPGGASLLPAALQSALVAANHGDPLLGPAMSRGFSDRAALAQIQAGWPAAASSMSELVQLARNAGEFLANTHGPRLASLETGSLDTHDTQPSRLVAGLSDLDQALGQLQATLGAAWAQTVVLTITEFGRTAAVNGSTGTDHGTAFAMFLAGGAVAGGKVLAQWPGLSASKLYQGRDLAPTTDLRSILMGVLRDHLGVSTSAFSTIFPGASNVSPQSGLIRA